MSADLRLLDVAAHDAAIDAIERRLADLPEAAALAEEGTAHGEALHADAELSGKRERAERDAKRFEDEVATLGAKLSSVGKKLHDGSVTNPRELTALQSEQAMLVRKQREVEDLQLELMLLLEDLAPLADESGHALERAKAALEAARESHDTVVGELQADLERERAAREQIAEGVDDKLLSVYDKVRRRSVVGAAALNGDVCSACHMKLTAPEVTEVKSSGLGRCPSCDVILVTES